MADVDEVLADPHLHARGFLTDHVTENGTVSLPNSPIRYAGSRLRPLTPPPTLGQHNEQVLGDELGLSAERIAELRLGGAR